MSAKPEPKPSTSHPRSCVLSCARLGMLEATSMTAAATSEGTACTRISTPGMSVQHDPEGVSSELNEAFPPPGPRQPPPWSVAPRLGRDRPHLLLRVLPHQREAHGVEIVLRHFPVQPLRLRDVPRPFGRDRELILDVGIERVALAQVRRRVAVLALIQRDEPLELVHWLELARILVLCEELRDAVRLLLGRGVGPPPGRPPPVEVGH